eukprot:CFRG4075T1
MATIGTNGSACVICGGKGLSSCSCKQRIYCSAECQSVDEKRGWRCADYSTKNKSGTAGVDESTSSHGVRRPRSPIPWEDQPHTKSNILNYSRGDSPSHMSMKSQFSTPMQDTNAHPYWTSKGQSAQQGSTLGKSLSPYERIQQRQRPQPRPDQWHSQPTSPREGASTSGSVSGGFILREQTREEEEEMKLSNPHQHQAQLNYQQHNYQRNAQSRTQSWPHLAMDKQVYKPYAESFSFTSRSAMGDDGPTGSSEVIHMQGSKSTAHSPVQHQKENTSSPRYQYKHRSTEQTPSARTQSPSRVWDKWDHEQAWVDSQQKPLQPQSSYTPSNPNTTSGSPAQGASRQMGDTSRIQSLPTQQLSSTYSGWYTHNPTHQSSSHGVPEIVVGSESEMDSGGGDADKSRQLGLSSNEARPPIGPPQQHHTVHTIRAITAPSRPSPYPYPHISHSDRHAEQRYESTRISPSMTRRRRDTPTGYFSRFESSGEGIEMEPWGGRHPEATWQQPSASTSRFSTSVVREAGNCSVSEHQSSTLEGTNAPQTISTAATDRKDRRQDNGAVDMDVNVNTFRDRAMPRNVKKVIHMSSSPISHHSSSAHVDFSDVQSLSGRRPCDPSHIAGAVPKSASGASEMTSRFSAEAEDSQLTGPPRLPAHMKGDLDWQPPLKTRTLGGYQPAVHVDTRDEPKSTYSFGGSEIYKHSDGRNYYHQAAPSSHPQSLNYTYTPHGQSVRPTVKYVHTPTAASMGNNPFPQRLAGVSSSPSGHENWVKLGIVSSDTREDGNQTEVENRRGHESSAIVVKDGSVVRGNVASGVGESAVNSDGNTDVDDKLKPYVCKWPGCGMRTAHQDDMKEHISKHTSAKGNDGKACETCKSEASSSTSGCKHTRSRRYMGPKPHACSWVGCEKRFLTKGEYESHMRTHTGEKPFKCDWEGCDKRFAQKGTMERHVRTHTGEKPFTCPYDGCTKTFAQKGNLEVHTRTHTGERPYKCQWGGCDKRFSYKSALDFHIRTHTGYKPYQCSWKGCDRRFTQQGNVDSHMRTHGDGKPYACPVEGCDHRYGDPGNRDAHVATHNTTHATSNKAA